MLVQLDYDYSYEYKEVGIVEPKAITQIAQIESFGNGSSHQRASFSHLRYPSVLLSAELSSLCSLRRPCPKCTSQGSRPSSTLE